MDLSLWLEIYRSICSELNMDPARDERAAQILSRELGSNRNIQGTIPCLNRVRKLLEGRECFIFGAGASLKKDLERFLSCIDEGYYETGHDASPAVISADGASSILLSRGIVPDTITTDLDGSLEDLMECMRNGALIVVHAHGDNMDRLKSAVPHLEGAVIGSTQTDPTGYDNIFNFGGFTDGDRAVILADEMGAERIVLAGFDLDSPAPKIGKGGIRLETERPHMERKRIKLSIASRIIDMVGSTPVVSMEDAIDH